MKSKDIDNVLDIVDRNVEKLTVLLKATLIEIGNFMFRQYDHVLKTYIGNTFKVTSKINAAYNVDAFSIDEHGDVIIYVSNDNDVSGIMHECSYDKFTVWLRLLREIEHRLEMEGN